MILLRKGLLFVLRLRLYARVRWRREDVVGTDWLEEWTVGGWLVDPGLRGEYRDCRTNDPGSLREGACSSEGRREKAKNGVTMTSRSRRVVEERTQGAWPGDVSSR